MMDNCVRKTTSDVREPVDLEPGLPPLPDLTEELGTLSSGTGSSCAGCGTSTDVRQPTDPGWESARGGNGSGTGLDPEEERVELACLELRVRKALKLPSYDAFHHQVLTKGWLAKISDGKLVFVRLRDKKRVGLERLGLREAFWWRVAEWGQNAR